MMGIIEGSYIHHACAWDANMIQGVSLLHAHTCALSYGHTSGVMVARYKYTHILMLGMWDQPFWILKCFIYINKGVISLCTKDNTRGAYTLQIRRIYQLLYWSYKMCVNTLYWHVQNKRISTGKDF